MKTRLYLAVIVLALLAGLFWWFFGSNPKPSTVSSANAVSNAFHTQPSPLPANSTPPIKPPSDAAVLARLAEFQAAIAGANGKSLDFYGKVIDQNGQPVVGAKVQGYVMTEVGFDRTKETPHVTQTDGEGNFEFLGLHGESLGVGPEKEGYEYIQRGNGNWTEDYKASSDNRVIFHMWKNKGAEPMLHTEKDSRLPYDNQTASFNLRTGAKSDTGDLRVTLSRTPSQVTRGGPPFDWSVQLAIDSGGLVAINDLYPNLAPDTGYQPLLQFSQSKEDPHWLHNLTKSFYVHLKDGTYGRITFDIVADSDRPDIHAGSGISIESFINPSGSRNLEYSREKEINP